jgi:hypothetical protein
MQNGFMPEIFELLIHFIAIVINLLAPGGVKVVMALFGVDFSKSYWHACCIDIYRIDI